MRYNGIICFLVPKRAILGNWGHITACRTARRPPSGKLKVSRVASGYVDVMISLSRVCLSPKKGDFMGVARRNLIFGLFLGQKWALAAPQELAQQHERHKDVVVLVSGHGGSEEIGGCGQKIDFWPKNPLLGPKRATLGSRGRGAARRAAERPPAGGPKVSRVASGCGGLMIQMSRVRLSRKNGGSWVWRGGMQSFGPKMQFFGPKSIFFG